MADVRQRTTFGNIFRFLLAALGLTALFAGVVGAVLLGIDHPTGEWATQDGAPKFLQGEFGERSQIAAILIAAAVVVCALCLLYYLVRLIFLSTSRRAASGANIYLQIGLALALFVVVNLYSFSHYRRVDCTRDGAFTLPPDVVNELKTITGQSDLIVLQLHKTAGSLSEKPDALDFAAERKVVEKVKDLVDQFRELGPKFRVTVLDIEEEGYESRVAALTANSPGGALRAAIETAPENSVLFHADGKVQRMSFSEFYLLDKSASRKLVVVDGKEKKTIQNLVLVPQGVRPFADRLLRIGEKKPKIGLAVIHPILSTREDEDSLSAPGFRAALEANGFEVVDIILKAGWESNSQDKVTPTATTYEEYDLDLAENSATDAKKRAEVFGELRTQFTEVKAILEKTPLADLSLAMRPYLRGGKFETEADRKKVLVQVDENLSAISTEFTEAEAEAKKSNEKYELLNQNERVAEARRQRDVKQKFRNAVADCDMLIVPRITATNLSRGRAFAPALFYASVEQAEVVKEFLSAGKPVMALFGPTNVGQASIPSIEPASDELEKVFTKLGIEFSSQVLMYDVESRAIGETRGREGFGGGKVELPAIVFDMAPKAGKLPNPVGEAFRLTGRAVDTALDIRKSGFRPIYLSDKVAAELPFSPEIAQSVKDGVWNEEKPLPARDYVPKLDPAKLDDPKRGTREEERRGPFPIGVLLEAKLPLEGLAKPDATPSAGTVRVAAIGHGGLVVGKKLDPAEERLLLHTINWQLKRDDRLPKDTATPEEKWRFPRVDLSPRDVALWHWGTFLGLPLVCVYFGFLVLMLRKIR